MSEKLIACVAPEVIKRREDEEIVTLDCKISLTRKEWAGMIRRMQLAAVLDRIGMSEVNVKDKIIAQIVAQHLGGA